MKIKNWLENLILLFIFLLPWPTAWIWQEGFINGDKWQYGTMVVYGTEALLWLVFIFFIFFLFKERKLRITNYEFRINDLIFNFKNSVIKNLFKIHHSKLKIYFALLFLLIWSFFSIFWSGNHELAFYRWFILAEAMAFFSIITKLSINKVKIYWTLVLAGIIQSILAVSQFLAQNISANKWLGIAAHSPATLGDIVVEAGGRFLRAYGSFSHPNILGGFLAVCFLVAFYLYFKETNWPRRFLLSASMILISAGLFFSFSRSAWLAGLVGYIVLLVICIKQKENRLALIRINIYLAVFLVSFFIIFQPLILTRLADDSRLEKKSLDERVSAAQEAGEVIKAHWFSGVGIGNYTNYLHQQNPNLKAWAYQPAHNIYMMVCSELGFVGLIVLMFLCFHVFMIGLKNKNWLAISVLMALALVGLFDHYLWTSYFGLVFWFLIMGLTAENSA